MNRFAKILTATSLLALAAGGAVAQSTTESETQNAMDSAERSLENAGESINNAVEATADAASSAAQEAGSEVEQALASDDDTNPGSTGFAIDMTTVVRARDLIGEEIYATVEAGDSWDSGTMWTTIGEGFSNIGEVEDLLLDSQGRLVGIVAEIGGFLDIGDKHVAIAADELRIGKADGKPYFVVNMTEEELENRESVDATWY